MFGSRMTSLKARLSARMARSLMVVGIAGAALASTACSNDSLTAPEMSAAPALRGDLVSTINAVSSTLISKTALLRSKPIASPITRSLTVSNTGGVISIPEAGVTLTIPKGAIGATPITISVTALPGSAVAYHFEPHGTKFLSKITLTQDLSGTAWFSNNKLKLGGGYFADDSQINLLTGKSLLNELLPVSTSGAKLNLDISHFSGYMVSMD